MQGHHLRPLGGFSARWCACAAAIGALITCTVVGNCAVLLALRRARRSPAHYPLASLAAADLLVGLFVLPVAAARELFVLQFHWVLCTCWETLDVLCCTASILSLCALGWERWWGIMFPLARAKRAKRSRMLACLVWPVAIAVALPTAFVYEPKHHPGDKKACPDNMNISYVFVSATVSFYVPAVVMLVLYARILCALAVPPNIRAHRGRSIGYQVSPIGKPAANATAGCSTPLPDLNLQETPRTPMLELCNTNINSNNSTRVIVLSRLLTPKGNCLNLPEGSKQVNCAIAPPLRTGEPKTSLCIISRQQAATRTIVRLMALFLVCWTPFFVMAPADTLCDCVWDPIWQWCTWLGYTNSALNPLVYAAASPSVRSALHGSQTSAVRSTEIQMQTPNRRT